MSLPGSSQHSTQPPHELRSARWFAGHTDTAFQHRAALRSMGIDPDAYAGRPVIGIANSWSQLNNCNSNLRELADAVSRGVLAAGGLPLEFPTLSLGEEFMKPSAMLYRNLMAMEVEETLRANPIDGVVLLVQLRQNHAGPAHGGRERRPAGDPAQRRAADNRALARRGGRDGHRSVEILGRAPCRPDQRTGLPRARSLLRLLGRRVQHDGHRLDDDGPVRSSRNDASRHLGHSGNRRSPRGSGRGNGPPHRRARATKTCGPRGFSRARHSTTPSAHCMRWAARPTQ